MKHCKDCEYSFWAGSEERGIYLACGSGVEKLESPLDGHMYYPTSIPCFRERNDGGCGLEAKNYKPKWYLWWRK